MSDQSDMSQRLVEKSIEGYIHALETINCLSKTYRFEVFAFLICNAWETLLKAKMLKDGENIYYKDNLTRTLSHSRCLEYAFPKENNPIRCNIESMITLRDEAMHLLIPMVPRGILAVSQVCVRNYHKHLIDWFDISLSERIPLGMMALVYDVDPTENEIEKAVLAKKLTPETAKYLMEKQKHLYEEWEQLGKTAEFSLAFDYTLALVEKAGDSDLTLTKGLTGDRIGVIEVAKDPSRTHPHRQTDVLHLLHEALRDIYVTSGMFQDVLKVFNVKVRSDFYYHGSVPGSPKQYSQALVEWIQERYQNDPLFFQKAKEKVRGTRIPPVNPDICLVSDGLDDANADTASVPSESRDKIRKA